MSERLNDFSRFKTFVHERFDPLSHFVMLALFLGAHTMMARFWTTSLHLPPINQGLLYLGVVVFFFKLRLYDEVKDYQTDLKINPTRPLPRGLVSLTEVKRGILSCLILEWILFIQAGVSATVAIAVASGYSLLMYREFFIGDLIRPHLTTYATTHTVVTLLLSLAIFAGLTGLWPWALPLEAYLFSLMSWLLFNIFELGRKTYLRSEEKEQVESYSKVWTRPGAIVLVLAHAALATWLALKLEITVLQPWMQTYLWGIVGLLGLSGLGVIFSSNGPWGKLYRGFSSFYIVLIYSGLLTALFKG